MPRVQIREKFQITIPRQSVRDHGLRVGDSFDFDVVNRVLTLSPESPVDRAILAGRADYAVGRFDGPFSSAAEGFGRTTPRAVRGHRHSRAHGKV